MQQDSSKAAVVVHDSDSTSQIQRLQKKLVAEVPCKRVAESQVKCLQLFDTIGEVEQPKHKLQDEKALERSTAQELA